MGCGWPTRQRFGDSRIHLARRSGRGATSGAARAPAAAATPLAPAAGQMAIASLSCLRMLLSLLEDTLPALTAPVSSSVSAS